MYYIYLETKIYPMIAMNRSMVKAIQMLLQGDPFESDVSGL